MYLSRLILDPKSRQVRSELTNAYEMHRTLSRAFDRERRAASMLFRVDVDRKTGVPTVLMQSAEQPNWDFAAEVDRYLLATDVANPDCKQFVPAFSRGQVLSFRLRANPTVKRGGKRLGLLKEEEQLAWLHRKGESGGFALLSCYVVPEGISKACKTDGDRTVPISLLSVRFDGVLRVTDPDVLCKTVESGIGPAKALGFGLLSVAPVR